MMDAAVEIRMQSGELQCSLCNAWTEHRWSVPTFNGDLVSNEFPDELWHPDGGMQAACEDCFNRHADGKLPTFDGFYIHLAGGFTEAQGPKKPIARTKGQRQ